MKRYIGLFIVVLFVFVASPAIAFMDVIIDDDSVHQDVEVEVGVEVEVVEKEKDSINTWKINPVFMAEAMTLEDSIVVQTGKWDCYKWEIVIKRLIEKGFKVFYFGGDAMAIDGCGRFDASNNDRLLAFMASCKVFLSDGEHGCDFAKELGKSVVVVKEWSTPRSIIKEVEAVLITEEDLIVG